MLNGFEKLWLYQFYVLARLSWGFLVQGLVLSVATELRDMVSVQLKRWAGLYCSAEVGTLFRSKSKGGLGLTPVDEHFQKMQLIKCSLLKSSVSGDVRRIYEHDAKRTSGMHGQWRPSQALPLLEAAVELHLQFPGQENRQGLGSGNFNPNPSTAERRKLVTEQFTRQCQESA